MKILQYTLLALVCCMLPGFLLVAIGPSLGSASSYLTFGLFLLYYFLREKNVPAIPFIILGMAYFVISGLIVIDDSKIFLNEFIKFIIMVVGGSQLARDISRKELYFVLLIGAMSILLHALLFQNGYGRYSGFYLNPNGAGFICIIGYSISICMPGKKLKYLGLFIFTFAGLLTFSRTFIVLWLLINLISIFVDKRNLINIMVGIGAVILLFSFAAVLQVNTVRFSALNNLFENNRSSSVSAFKEDSRTETWSQYYDMIYERPFLGNGYHTLSGSDLNIQGVHNSFLLAIGEAGIITFLLMVGIYLMLIFKSLRYFITNPEYLFLSIALATILMVSHNYFTNYIIIFLSVWLYFRIKNDTNNVIINNK